MQTRKFIWHFFLAIVFSITAISEVYQAWSKHSFWHGMLAIIALLILSNSVERINDTFKND